MGSLIDDEYAALPISRQRKYYLRMRRDKRCTKCGKPAERASLCLEHLIQMREYRRKIFGLKRRYQGSLSYQQGVPAVNGTKDEGAPVNIAQNPGVPESDPVPVVIKRSNLEAQVPADHPLRGIKQRVTHLLRRLSPALAGLRAQQGELPVPAEQVLKCWVLMTLYSVGSKRLFCEQLSFNVLWLWFLDRGLPEGGFGLAEFNQAYERLLRTDVARSFFQEVFTMQVMAPPPGNRATVQTAAA